MIKDRYSLEWRLDQGRFGMTYRAVDTRRSTPSAPHYVHLWVLPAELSENEAALDAFKRDVARIQELSHPSIARVLDLDRDGGTHFVTSELVDGETLRDVVDHLQPERLDSNETDVILRAVGDALAYAHERGVVHGDVRLENIVVTTDHAFKLMNIAFTSLMRHAPFAAVPADDVHQLAAVAYELYTGAPLGHGERARRIKGPPRQRWRAIEAVLAQRPERRQIGMREFLSFAGLTDDRRPQPGFDRGSHWRPAPSRRPVMAVGFASVGAAVLAFAWVGGGGRLGELAQRGGSMLGQLGTELAPRARDEAASGAVNEIASAEPGPEQTLQAHASSRRPSSTTGHDGLLPGRDEATPDLAPAAAERPAPEGEAAARAPGASAPTALEDPGNDAADVTGPAVLSLSAAAVAVYEGQAAVAIDIVRSGNLQGTVEIAWWTQDDTAHAGDDYAAMPRQTERFAPGETARKLYIPIVNDDVPEPREVFLVHLDPNPDGARIGDIPLTEITIIDDD